MRTPKLESALGSHFGQLCRFHRAAEHASRTRSDLRSAFAKNLIVPINDGQQRTPDKAHLRIGFVSRR